MYDYKKLLCDSGYFWNTNGFRYTELFNQALKWANDKLESGDLSGGKTQRGSIFYYTQFIDHNMYLHSENKSLPTS